MTGPAFDYADYDKFIHGTLFDDVPQDKDQGKTKEEYLDLVSKHLKSFCWGFFWAFLLLQSDKFVTMEYMFSPEFVQYHGLFYRIIYMWILGFTFRLKYYTIWTIAEGACILCGIGYNGVDRKQESSSGIEFKI